jgi:DNA-directed RNA polymerase specialized sigma24 family protein
MDMFDHSNARYPHSAGHRGVDTSIEAAQSIQSKLGNLQATALNAIIKSGLRGLTADELAVTLGLDRYSIQPRTSELKRLGKIKDSGQRRKNTTGKMAIVWVATNLKIAANP